MSGLYYAVFTLGILVVIRWYIQNEQSGNANDGDKGFLAMRMPSTPPEGGKPGAEPRSAIPSRRQHMAPNSKKLS